MSALLRLAAKSAWNRRFVLFLVALSIALSTFLLLGIERIRTDVRENFSQSVSGTDLIVGARTGSVQLLLYSVFRIGSATNNIRWSSVQAIDEAARRRLGRADLARRLASRLRGGRDVARLLRPLPVRRPSAARARPRASASRVSSSRSRRRSREQARLQARRPDRRSAMATASSQPTSMPTSRSPSSASSPAPERRSIAPCTSACRRWRRSISTGWRVRRFRGPRSRRRRLRATTSRRRTSPPRWSA